MTILNVTCTRCTTKFAAIEDDFECPTRNNDCPFWGKAEREPSYPIWTGDANFSPKYHLQVWCNGVVDLEQSFATKEELTAFLEQKHYSDRKSYEFFIIYGWRLLVRRKITTTITLMEPQA